jgi:hypothetical protein
VAVLTDYDDFHIEFVEGLGFTQGDIELSWTDELMMLYYNDAVEWSSMGKPMPIEEYFPHYKTVTPGVTKVTNVTRFWLSKSGQALGNVMDDLNLPEIGAKLRETLVIAAVVLVTVLGIAVYMRR